MEIFRLFGSIFIENEKANKSLRDTEKQATDVGKTLQETTKAAIKFGDELGKRLTDVGSKMTKLAGVPLAALKAAMFGLAKTTADYTATVMDNARVVGLSAEAYQELQYAMAQSGLSQDDFVRMMGRVNQRIGMARQGNEKYRKSLQALGISLEDLDKGLVGTEEAFIAMIDYLHQMEDSQQQAAVAGDFFGVMLARRMMPLIRDGAESVEELRQRAHELGLVMDDLAIAKGDLLSDTLDDLSFTAKGLGRIFGSEMHAPLINISKAITDVIARFSTWLTENPKVVRQIIVWGGAIAGVLGVLVTLGTTMIVTGKIIGALGAIFNILTSKPILIIAAIGALYLAWESDWLGIRTAVENAWAKIEPVIDAIIEWGHQTIETIWNWTTEILSKFLEWLLETAWPWINDTVETTWDWAKGTVSKFIEWIKDTAWPYIDGVAKTTWSWLAGTVDKFISWIKDTAWPVIKDGASTVWSWSKGKWDSFVEWLYAQWGFIVNGIDTIWGWSKGYIDKFVTWIYQTAWPVISGGAKTLWSWAVGALDAFMSWIYETAWPWINGTVTTTWEWTVKGLDWLRELLGITGIDMGLTPEEEYAENLQYAIAEVMKHPEELWGEYTAMYARIWDVDENEIRKALGLPLIEQTIDAIDEATEGAVTLQELLDAIYRAEGGPGARVPYGMTGFEGGVEYRSEIDQARFEELAAGLEVGSEAYWRAAAQTTVEHYWRWFKTRFPELGEKTFDEVGPEIQSMFIAYLGSHFSPPEAHELNRNWVPNVLALVGFDELAQEFRAGNERVMDAWIGAIYDKAGDVEAAVEWITGIVARYMVGTSPPPEGPLSDIDEGGAAIMEAWTEGVVEGLDEGKSKLTTALEKIRELFSAIWEKVPEEIREPINKAIGYVMDLVSQAEEALFKLDEFQEELDALMGGGASPEEQAQGFMARLAAGLNEKLDKLDEPMNRLVDAVYTAGATLFEFGKAIASGNWLDALLTLIMETEAFALAMEILNKVMKPFVVLLDNILLPIVKFIAQVWNTVIDLLASISIFGWKPFAGLADYKIEMDEYGHGEKGDREHRGTVGRQISEITGPTRDLLVDLLSPLANFGQIVAPIQDIRNILYERMPNFNSLSLDFAGVGAGAIGPGVVIENITVHSSAKDGRQLARDMMDEIEREMARRINFGIRGRGGR